MGKRETPVENYLRDQVSLSNSSMAEKHTSPGRRGVPDELITWWHGAMDLVETKAKDGVPEDHQIRDHIRRAKLGVPVYLLDTFEKVDMYISMRNCNNVPVMLFSVPLSPLALKHLCRK